MESRPSLKSLSMNTTPTPPLVKSQLSSSLKERLKKCGRYHASPEPVARQPKIPVNTSREEKTQNEATLKGGFLSPQIKRQCMDDLSGTLHREDKELTGCHSNNSPVLTRTTTLPHQSSSLHLENVKLDKETTKSSSNKHSLNQTPLTQRSWSRVSQVKGSKLTFEGASKENFHQEEKDTESYNVESSRGAASSSEQSNKSDLVESNLDPFVVSSRSGLLKEVEIKEEQLRKLRMVKMYRSKNNLEELQTLIDKWRAVSQQAMQDLHVAMPEPRPSLTELINHLGIDHQLLHFSAEDDETFF